MKTIKVGATLAVQYLGTSWRGFYNLVEALQLRPERKRTMVDLKAAIACMTAGELAIFAQANVIIRKAFARASGKPEDGDTVQRYERRNVVGELVVSWR